MDKDIQRSLEKLDMFREKTHIELEQQKKSFINEIQLGLGDQIKETLRKKKEPKKLSRFKRFMMKIFKRF